MFERVLPLEHGQRPHAVQQATPDEVVRREVMALLAVHEDAGSFLEPPPATLDSGDHLGRYEILSHIGSGGMGEVYRAHDTRLHRDVAIKVLHRPAFDTAAKARFEREARAVASLSHPNVVAIYDVGEGAGLPYLVMELLNGETLRARLARGSVSVAQAVAWSVEIADGLAAAHARGIVHRDLKPENVFIVERERVRVLDFGIARSLSEERSKEPGEMLTLPGRVPGTPGYASPEQVRGEVANQAADLFALGAILFEALTGTKAFCRSNIADTLRATLDHEPPLPSSMVHDVPAWLDRVVQRLLEKDVLHRFESARDLRFALCAAPPSTVALRVDRKVARASLILFSVVFIACALVVGPLLSDGALRDGSTSRALPAFGSAPLRTYALTHSGDERTPAVSHDGRFLAYASTLDGVSRIWLEQLGRGAPTPLTEGPDTAPRFSPDGHELLFTRAGDGGPSLYRVSLLGGTAYKVIDQASEGDWSPDGQQITFVRWHNDSPQARPLVMIAKRDGSDARVVAELRERRRALKPRWSPDGRWISATGLVQQPGALQTVILLSTTGEPHQVLPTPQPVGVVSAAVWHGPNALIYSQATSVTGNSGGGASRIVRYDLTLKRFETLAWNLHESPVIDVWPGKGVVHEAVATRQELSVVTGSAGARRLLPETTARDRQPVFSPDGTRVVFSSDRGANLDLWMLELETGTTYPITDHPGDDWDPAFTPDGRTIIWSSNRTGHFEIWSSNLDGSEPRQVTNEGADAENPTATRDGKWLVYSSGAAERAGVWRVSRSGDAATRLVADVLLPEVSPDGQYVLFQSNRGPQQACVGVARVSDGQVLPFEIIIDLAQPGGPLTGRARWMPDGKAIAFLGQDERGVVGVYRQAFDPQRDTRVTRRPWVFLDGGRGIESFGLAPDGEQIIVSGWESRSRILAAVATAER